MKKVTSRANNCLALAMFLFLAYGPAAAQRTVDTSRIAVRVYFATESERQQLERTMSVDEHAGGRNYVMVSMTVDDMKRLVQKGTRAERDDVYTAHWNQNVGWLATASKGPLALTVGVHSLAAIQQFFDQKVTAYPNLTESITIGPSWCKTQGGCKQTNPLVQTNGSDLRVLKITNRNIPGPKPAFWIDAGIHANEFEPPELLLKFVSWLLDGYNIDSEAHWLVDSREIHVLFVVNPDGREFVEQLPGPFVRLVPDRKNAHPLGCTLWPATPIERLGVDLNRNFPVDWFSTIDVPCGPKYPGTSPLSEPETRAVHDYLQNLFSSRLPPNGAPAPLSTSGTFLNAHSAGGTTFIPWNGINETPPNQVDLLNIGLHLTAKRYKDGSPIQYNGGFVCQPSAAAADNECYDTTHYPATAVDTVYGKLGIFANALEVSPGHLPSLDYHWYENKRNLAYLANIADQPYLHARGPDALLPAKELLVTHGGDVTISATLRTDWVGIYGWGWKEKSNQYSQNIGGAEYYVGAAPAPLGKGGTPMLPTDGAFNSPVEAVSATLNTRNFEPGQWVPILVRGRGVESYSEGDNRYLSWGGFSSVFVRTYPATTPGFGSGNVVARKSGDGTTVLCYSFPAPDFYPKVDPSRGEGALRGCQLAADTDLRVGQVVTKFSANSPVFLYPDGAVEAGFTLTQKVYAGQAFYTEGGLVWAGYPTTSVRGLHTVLGTVVPPLKALSVLFLSSDGKGTFESGEIEAGTSFDGLLPSGAQISCGGPKSSGLKVFPNGYLKSCRLRTDTKLIREDLSVTVCAAGNTASFDMFGKVTACSP